MSRHHTSLHSRRWAAIRRAVFERDGYRCTVCARAGALEAHHEPPLRQGGDPYDLTGIKTLCRTCHVERHRPDNETPGRAEWRELVAEISGQQS